jgi:hypothetical protein
VGCFLSPFEEAKEKKRFFFDTTRLLWGVKHVWGTCDLLWTYHPYWKVDQKVSSDEEKENNLQQWTPPQKNNNECRISVDPSALEFAPYSPSPFFPYSLFDYSIPTLNSLSLFTSQIDHLSLFYFLSFVVVVVVLSLFLSFSHCPLLQYSVSTRKLYPLKVSFFAQKKHDTIDKNQKRKSLQKKSWNAYVLLPFLFIYSPPPPSNGVCIAFFL